MKKFLITLFAVFYLGVSSGAILQFHYCMGQLTDWGLSNDTTQNAGNCSNCGMNKGNSEDCCTDKKQEFKVKESQTAQVNSCQVQVFALESISYPVLPELALTGASDLISGNKAPPRAQRIPVFIRNCNFRI